MPATGTNRPTMPAALPTRCTAPSSDAAQRLRPSSTPSRVSWSRRVRPTLARDSPAAADGSVSSSSKTVSTTASTSTRTPSVRPDHAFPRFRPYLTMRPPLGFGQPDQVQLAEADRVGEDVHFGDLVVLD